MDINITKYFNSESHYDVSCSQATHGAFAGTNSYSLAKQLSEEFNLITNDETRLEVVSFFESFGAWGLDEIQGWTNEELNGLLLQFISGDINEASGLDFDFDSWNWNAYEFLNQEGVLSSRLFKGVDNEIYYNIDS